MADTAKETNKNPGLSKSPSHTPENGGSAAWYDIAIAGKRFTIASRLGEDHIRDVERLLNETYDGIKSRSKGQSILHLALLTALNLADQLLALKNSQQGLREDWERRLDWIVGTLDAALTAENPAVSSALPEDAPPGNGMGSGHATPSQEAGDARLRKPAVLQD